MYAIKIMSSFNELREGEVFQVGPEFLEKFGQYVQVIGWPADELFVEDEPVEDAKAALKAGAKARTAKPKKVETDAEAVQGEGSDLQGEGEQPRP